MDKKKIVVIGSSNTDMIVSVSHLPKPGETILGNKFHTAAGGKGANQAVSSARAGGDVTFIARIGKDTLGDQSLSGFVKDGIHVEYVFRDKSNPSGVALIYVSQTGQNSIAVAGGANNHLSPLDIKKAASAITHADILVAQLETPLPTIKAAITLAAKKGIPVILNPAPAQKLPISILRHVSILTPNETEAELLTGIKITNHKSAAKAAHTLLKQGVKTVIITLGHRGAWVATDKFQKHIPTYQVKAIDATAAGDTFNGALAVALAEGKSLHDAIRFSNAAAALSVMKKGAQTSIPKRIEIEKFLKKY